MASEGTQGRLLRFTRIRSRGTSSGLLAQPASSERVAVKMTKRGVSFFLSLSRQQRRLNTTVSRPEHALVCLFVCLFILTAPNSAGLQRSLLLCLLTAAVLCCVNCAESLCCGCAESLSRVQLFVTPWSAALQAPLSMGILNKTRILEWAAMPPPGDLPNLGIKLRPSALLADSLPSEPPGKPNNTGMGSLSLLQGIFLTQESNQGLPHCRWILYKLSYQGSPCRS